MSCFLGILELQYFKMCFLNPIEFQVLCDVLNFNHSCSTFKACNVLIIARPWFRTILRKFHISSSLVWIQRDFRFSSALLANKILKIYITWLWLFLKPKKRSYHWERQHLTFKFLKITFSFGFECLHSLLNNFAECPCQFQLVSHKFGWLVVLMIYVILAIFQPHHDLEAGDYKYLRS